MSILPDLGPMRARGLQLAARRALKIGFTEAVDICVTRSETQSFELSPPPVDFFLMLFRHGPSGHFFGPLAIAPGALSALLYWRCSLLLTRVDVSS